MYMFFMFAVSLAANDFSLIVDVDKSMAVPGSVPLVVEKRDFGLETGEWKTEPTNKPVPGKFTLSFTMPVQNSTVVTYDAGAVECLAEQKWYTLDDGRRPVSRLRLLPFPPDKSVESVRVTVPAGLKPEYGQGTPSYSTILPPMSILPFRAVNIAPDAAVVASSTGSLSQGFRPQPWRNRPETLVDGFIDFHDNFSTAPKTPESDEASREWVMLAWEQPQAMQVLAVLRGQHEVGVGDPAVEVYTGVGDPRFSINEKDWVTVSGKWTSEGSFRSIRWFVFARSVRTRGLRLKRADAEPIQLGEIVVLQNIGKTEVAAAAKPAGVPITFTIQEAGKVTIQVRSSTDEVVANPVAGQKFQAGTHTVYWNLEDIDGNSVLDPGTYSWRGLFVPKLEVEYKFTYYPTPLPGVAWETPSRRGGWLADHEPPRTIARGNDGTMWLGAFAEGGSSIMQVNEKAEKLWGIDRLWVAIPSEISTDGDYYYGFCEGGWIGENQVILQVDQRSKSDRKIFQRPIEKVDDESGGTTTPTGPTGFQVVGNLAFVSFGKFDVIQVFDLSEGMAGPHRGFGWNHAYTQFEDQKPVLIKEISVPSPGRLRKLGNNKLVSTSEQDVITIDLDTYKVETLFAGILNNPLGLGVHPDGKLIFIGEGEPAHQVTGYDLKGNVVVRFGKSGKRRIGPFDEQDLEAPSGVEVDANGYVWIMEYTHYPKRVSIWDAGTGKCVNHVLGPTPYGGGGSIDPENENILFHRGLEFKRDPGTEKITLVNLIYRPDAPEFAHFSEDDYPCYAFRTPDPTGKSGSRLWFTSHMWPHQHPSLVLWEYKKDRVQPVAAVGSAIALRQPLGEPAPRKGHADWYDTSPLQKHISDYDPDDKFFTWTDLNDDGYVQASELHFGKLEHNGTLLREASAGWNWRMNPSFEAAANAGAERIVYFRPYGFSAHGYPLYKVPVNTLPGRSESLMPDGKGNIIQLLSSTSPDGRVRWRYRNEWPGLHAGHHTTARGDEPGVVIAPCRIWGVVPVNDEIGEVVAFNSNLGCTYLMTADDGLFIDRIFRDQRVGLLWNTETPPTPEVLAETSLYDEHFGGSLQKIHCTDGIDRFFYVVGKHHCTVVELTGLDDIKRLPGGKIRVTPKQIAEIETQRQQIAGRKPPPRVLRIPGIKTGTIKIDGDASEWPEKRTDGFALAYDDTYLHVLYQGYDNQATFENKGVNPLELFKTGDVIDVMMQTRADVNPDRTVAEAGDIRLSFSMFQGEPVCVLYNFVIPGHKGVRVPFSSPWRTILCDRVDVLDSAKIHVQRSGEYYTLEASVPLKDIGLNPQSLRTTRGDIGRVMSDVSATRVTQRIYWSNKNTAILSDLPSEAGLQPNLWGSFVFE